MNTTRTDVFFVKNGPFEQKQQTISSFLRSKKQKRENKDGVSCIIEYYYDRCFFTKILWKMVVLSKNNKALVVFRVVKQKKKL